MKIGFTGALTLILLVLKVLGIVKIGWLLVFAPLLFGPAVALFLMVFTFGIALLAAFQRD